MAVCQSSMVGAEVLTLTKLANLHVRHRLLRQNGAITSTNKPAMKYLSFSTIRQTLVPPSREGWVLGYFGLVPFVFLACVSWLAKGALQHSLLFALLAYGASILSFLGAIHWGLAFREPQLPPARMLAWGVMPSLWAWVALMAGSTTGLWLITFGLCVCLAVDWRVYPRFGLSNWLGMRVLLTMVASMSCVTAALGVVPAAS